METDSPHPHYPIVVIGGGMVGASFALALEKLLPADAGSAVLVVEAAAAGNNLAEQPSFDTRSTALSWGTRRIFDHLGLWNDLAEHAEPIKRIHVSDRGHFGSTTLECGQMQVEALGYVLENRHLGKVFNSRLKDCVHVDVLRPATVTSIAPNADGMELQLQCGSARQKIHAQLVVLADGGRSSLCQQLGIDIRVEDYHQQAIISNIAFEQEHANVAYERFTEAGPLAVLPLGKYNDINRAALVWTVAEQDIDKLLSMPDTEAIEQLQERFGFRLGRIMRMGTRVAYPLSLSVAQEQVRPGLVLLGNAAHTLHPVAGQGFNLALRDANALAENLIQSFSAGVSPGTMSVLQQFLDRQQQDQRRTIDMSHYTTRIFSNQRTSLVWMRKLGLAAIDLIPALKQEFARQAMGLADR